jgi:glyoxylase I family protein
MDAPLAAPPFTLRRIDHIVLRVANLEAAVGFYQRVLGCTVEKRRDDLGLVHLRAGDALIDLVSLDGTLGRRGGAGPGETGRNVDHFCLRIDPFDEDEIFRHLERHGISAHEKKVYVQFGADGEGPALLFSDPDGNLIELKGKTLANDP